MSVQFKDGIWYAVIYYRDEFNKKRYKWYPVEGGEKDAERLERRLRTQKDDGDLTITKKSTVKQFLDKWHSLEIEGVKHPTTATNYANQMKYLCENLGEISLEKLDAISIQSHFKKEYNRGLKPTSVKSQYDVLNQALKKAVKWKLLSKNPCDDVEAPKRNEPSNGILTMEQVNTFLDFIKDNTAIYIVGLLGFLCGLRRGEILGLQWQDIDLKNKTAFIRHSLDRMDEEKAIPLLKQKTITWFGCRSVSKKGKATVLALGPTKTKQSKGHISIPDVVITVLEFIRKKQMVEATETHQLCDQNFVIRHKDGLPYEPDYITHAIPKLIKRYNKDKTPDKQIPEIRAHDMRHTYVTILYELGLDTKSVSEAARHAKSSFTSDYYVHLRNEVKMRPAQILNAQFDKGLGNGLGKGKKTTKKASG